VKFQSMLGSNHEGLLVSLPTSESEEHPLTPAYPRLLIQDIPRYSSYVEAVTSTINVRTFHNLVTRASLNIVLTIYWMSQNNISTLQKSVL